ncbi:MAG: polysaccharide pyruvyl transferase family protein [Myxococcales bacterium]|nr:polysaccharide pyruvyl transferase family protein [Myxococcales bacterium]
MLGFLGAYSIDNAGDALVGYATRRAVLALVPGTAYQVLAPALPHPFWGHRWDRERGLGDELRAVPATDDCGWAADLDALIIGGGGLLNLDPSFAPFRLGDPARWPARCAVAWNALGSQNQPWYLAAHRADYARIRACCERLAYVSVRNRTTLRFVRECGFDGEVHVVPDPAIGLAELPAAVERDVDALLARLGLAPRRGRGRPLIGVSLGAALSSPAAAPFFAALERELRALAPDCDLVFFRFSVMQDEAAAARALADRLGARTIAEPLAPLRLWGLIGRLDAYVGSRFHGVLAAYTQDVPFVAVDEYLRDAVASSKIRELVVERALEVHYVCPYLPDASAWKVRALVDDRARVSYAARVADDRRRLAAHYRALLDRLGLRAATG